MRNTNNQAGQTVAFPQRVTSQHPLLGTPSPTFSTPAATFATPSNPWVTSATCGACRSNENEATAMLIEIKRKFGKRRGGWLSQQPISPPINPPTHCNHLHHPAEGRLCNACFHFV